MCGIAGVFFKNRKRIGLLDAFREMVETHQGKRGPDDFNALKVRDGLWFFHNRLAIIDPGRAVQPMHDSGGVITFNGEIYNFKDLRLKDESYELNSDTEVLLKGLNRQGAAFLERTHSMFAFGYYANESRELMLARDRLGIKQIYYIDTVDVFAFASTLTPLMVFSSAEVDDESLFGYYLNRAMKAPRTLMRDIRKLEAGHTLRFDTIKGAVVRNEAWWTAQMMPRETCSEPEILDELDRLLREAITHRLVSDVPVGAYLSGGVDSSLMVAIAAESLPNMEVFSVAMDDPKLDESRHAAAIAERFGLKHHVIVAEPDSFLDEIEDWALIQDDMVADPAALMLYKLSNFAHQAGFKVMLSGEGADEAFAGYNAQFRYALSLRYHPLFKALRPLRRPINRLLANRAKLYQFTHQLINGPAYYGASLIFEPVILERLFPGKHPAPQSVQSLSEAVYRDIIDRLPNDLLVRTDRATMGASIEARVPFLSHDLISYSLGVSEKLLVKGFTQKYLVKKLAERYVPRSNIYRKKVGFDLPLADWQRGPLRPILLDLLENSWQSEWIDIGFIREMIDLQQAYKIDASDKLWAFMMLELNYRGLCDIRRRAAG